MWRRWSLVDVDHPEAGRVTVAVHTVESTARRVVGDYLGVAAGRTVRDRGRHPDGPQIPRCARQRRRGTWAPAEGGHHRALAAKRRRAATTGGRRDAQADVVLCAASTSLYHTAAKAIAQRAGVRGDFNAPHRADAWRNGAMTADLYGHPQPGEMSGRAVAGTARVIEPRPAGTDLTATVTGREPEALADRDLPQPGRGLGTPRRRGLAAPLEGGVEGIVVWERVASDLGASTSP